MPIVVKTFIITLLTHRVWSSTHAVFGQWKQLNPKNCGLTRLSTEVDTECFEWHKFGVFGEIKSGRNVTAGETPFLALVAIERYKKNENTGVWNVFRTKCSGSVIAQQWVLTAAHCIKKDYDANITIINIVIGSNFTYWQWRRARSEMENGRLSKEQYHNLFNVYNGIKRHIHPNYIPLEVTVNEENGNQTERFTESRNDIALIQMDRPIGSGAHENSICLPNEFIREKDGRFEYGLIAGFGGYGESSNISSGSLPPQIGYFRIFEGSPSKIYTSEIDLKPNDSLACKGDSGAPLWQYYMGRAVVIGVESETGEYKTDGCGSSVLVRVSRYIDWIINVTHLDYDHLEKTGHQII